MDYLTKLAATIESGNNCKAKHTGTTSVQEVFKGKPVWEGEVETFDLTGHPKAKRCFAWGYRQADGKWEITTVLEIPPVVSPETAVRAAIVATAKK